MSRVHETNSPSCWCRPRLERVCPACEGEKAWSPLEPPCWMCKGEGRIVARASDSGILVIHNEEDAEVGMQLERRDGGSGAPRWPPREDLEGARSTAEDVEIDDRPWWSKPAALLAMSVIALALAVVLASC